jgi:hypothetical protein
MLKLIGGDDVSNKLDKTDKIEFGASSFTKESVE